MKTKEKILVCIAIFAALIGSYFVITLPENAATNESIKAGVQCLSCWSISLLCLFVNMKIK